MHHPTEIQDNGSGNGNPEFCICQQKSRIFQESRILHQPTGIQDSASANRNPGFCISQQESRILHQPTGIQDSASANRNPGFWISQQEFRILHQPTGIQDSASANRNPGLCISQQESRILHQPKEDLNSPSNRSLGFCTILQYPWILHLSLESQILEILKKYNIIYNLFYLLSPAYGKEPSRIENPRRIVFSTTKSGQNLILGQSFTWAKLDVDCVLRDFKLLKYQLRRLHHPIEVYGYCSSLKEPRILNHPIMSSDFTRPQEPLYLHQPIGAMDSVSANRSHLFTAI